MDDGVACARPSGHRAPIRRIDDASRGDAVDRAVRARVVTGLLRGCRGRLASRASTVPRPISITRPDTRMRRSAVDLEAEAAGPADGLALVDGEPLRQRRAGREQPAAEVGARGAGARILDDRAVLRRRRSAPSTRSPSAREDVRHRALAVAAVREQQLGARRGAAHRVGATRAGSRAAPTPVSTHSGGAAGSARRRLRRGRASRRARRATPRPARGASARFACSVHDVAVARRPE